VLASFRPDVVLMDVGMPGLDGYETARRMRARPEGERVLLVAVTGYGQDADVQRALEAGFDRHLTKPVRPSAVLDLVDEAAKVAK
jgi:CheY-like chemotaxis protein